MNPRRAFARKITYLVFIALLLVPLYWLGQPASADRPGAAGSPGGLLARFRAEHGLAQTHLGEIDPTSETIKLATVGLRGMATNILWSRAHHHKRERDWTSLAATINQLVRLQPHFTRVWEFNGWEMAYNVSAEFDDYRDRYRWVIRGIEFTQEGIPYNQRESRLVTETGRMIGHKIARSDERRQFRRLFVADDDFHGPRPMAERDNWLVSKSWHEEAVRMVDLQGADIRGHTPHIFYSFPAMAQMNYASDLMGDGVFGQTAQRAWRQAGADWEEYGQRDVPTTYEFTIRLADREGHLANVERIMDEIDALDPGVRQRVMERREAMLTDEEREALATPLNERTGREFELALLAEQRLRVRPRDLAEAVQGPNRARAFELAREADEEQNMADVIDIYRTTVNYEYWRTRAVAEQDTETLAARQAIFEGDRLFQDEGDLTGAREAYEEGLVHWRVVLDRYPQFLSEDERETHEALYRMVRRYEHLLHQMDEELPEPFILQDVLDNPPPTMEGV